MFLLDTDHLVILQLRDGELFAMLRQRMDAHANSDFFVSIVSLHEQVNGWQAYLRRQRTNKQIVRAYQGFEQILCDFLLWQVAAFDDRASERFSDLRRERVRVPTMDLRIAAISPAHDFTVLTRNLVDFEKVPGLKVEDWTVAAPEKPR